MKVHQHQNVLGDNVKVVELLEAETRTPASTEIHNSLRKAGYKLLGKGADATVWAKKTGPVLKIIMPDDGQGAGPAGDTFMKFYNFCKDHPDLENLPNFSGGADVFSADGKDYIMVTMERLKPIPKGSFEEAMVWQLSDLSTKNIKWREAYKLIQDPKEWKGYDSADVNQIIDHIKNFSRAQQAEYGLLFTLMSLLWHQGKINKQGWDLHTENAMMRGDTIVITDPWFNEASE